MNKDEITALGIVAGVLLLATGVAIGGGMVYARGFWHKNSALEIKKTEKSNVDNPEIFSAYMRDMQRKIKSNWEPPTKDVSKSTTLFYSINKDGSLKRYSVLKSSGDRKFDNAAIKALRTSSPFRPLPKDFKGEYVDVQFTFDYNVWEKKK